MRYLSDEWFRAADELVRSDSTLADLDLAQPLALGYRVTGGPDGDRRWRVVLDGDRSRVETTADSTPDVEFVQAWETAVAIARGQQNAPAAFLAGAVTVEGDRQLLVRHAAPLGLIGGVLSPLAERTEW